LLRCLRGGFLFWAWAARWRHRCRRPRRGRPARAARGPTPVGAVPRPAGSRAASRVTYTVKAGDTLSGIAEWFKLHGYGALYAANEAVIGSNPNLIFAGERITITKGVMKLGSAP
jgi:nucleoid-associated protein YgaU